MLDLTARLFSERNGIDLVSLCFYLCLQGAIINKLHSVRKNIKHKLTLIRQGCGTPYCVSLDSGKLTEKIHMGLFFIDFLS